MSTKQSRNRTQPQGGEIVNLPEVKVIAPRDSGGLFSTFHYVLETGPTFVRGSDGGWNWTFTAIPQPVGPPGTPVPPTVPAPKLPRIPGTPGLSVNGLGIVTLIYLLWEMVLENDPDMTLEDAWVAAMMPGAYIQEGLAEDWDDHDVYIPPPSPLPGQVGQPGDAANDPDVPRGTSPNEGYYNFQKEDFAWSENMVQPPERNPENIAEALVAAAVGGVEGAGFEPEPPPVTTFAPTLQSAVAMEAVDQNTVELGIWIAPPLEQPLHIAAPTLPMARPQVMNDISVQLGTALINATTTYLDRNRATDLLPEVSLKLAFNANPSATKPHIGTRIRVSPSVRPSRVAEHVLTMDGKHKGQIAYMAALSLVNRTWGKLDEVIDAAEVLVDSLIIDGIPLTQHPEWHMLVNPATKMEAIWQAGLEGRLDLNQQKFIQGMFAEIITDLAIGYLSRAELAMMRNIFPPDHPLMNAFGMPTTWARRLGYDAIGPYVKPIGSVIRGG